MNRIFVVYTTDTRLAVGGVQMDSAHTTEKLAHDRANLLNEATVKNSEVSLDVRYSNVVPLILHDAPYTDNAW